MLRPNIHYVAVKSAGQCLEPPCLAIWPHVGTEQPSAAGLSFNSPSFGGRNMALDEVALDDDRTSLFEVSFHRETRLARRLVGAAA